MASVSAPDLNARVALRYAVVRRVGRPPRACVRTCACNAGGRVRAPSPWCPPRC